ncbi:breast cancer type 2 susceptibility protein isoform X2 [Amia ocellicauda]|uniref:breast cancer type 2 susceptibility protein isoform X2 n=1 Tax=Amia ocellicauda TaxID=2972642 RepID=UPI00346456BD
MTGFSVNDEMVKKSRRPSMFELFKHRFIAELGPLHPDWFEELTTAASAGPAADKSNGGEPAISKAHCGREDCFKTPWEKPAVDSQMSSTPRIFRGHSHPSPEAVTPEQALTLQERSNVEGSKAVSWADTSPCLFGLSKESPAGFNGIFKAHLNTDNYVQGLLDTPKCPVALSSKRISESLGAEMDADLSWSSSLNTPPILTPTLILSKAEDASRPKRHSEERSGIFVRKLFPSITSKETNSALAELPAGKNDPTAVKKLEDELDSQMKKKDSVSDESQDEVMTPWKQTLPDALQDQEVRSAVASVLDGAEDTLSVFFRSSVSSLRRVKPKERSRRKLMSTAKSSDCPLETPMALTDEASKAVCQSPLATEVAETRTARDSPTSVDQPGSRPAAIDCGNSQWSQLTFLDILDTQLERACPAVPQRASVKEPNENGTTLSGRPMEGVSDPALESDIPEAELSNKRPNILDGVKIILQNQENEQEWPDQRPALKTQMGELRRESYEGSPTDLLLLKVQMPGPNDRGPSDRRDTDMNANGNCSQRRDGPSVTFCSVGSPVQTSSLVSSSTVTSTRKPPRKFVYSLQSPLLSHEPKCTMSPKNAECLLPADACQGTLSNEKSAERVASSTEGNEAENQTKSMQSAKEYNLSQISTVFADDFSQDLHDGKIPFSVHEDFTAMPCLTAVRCMSKHLPPNNLQTKSAPTGNQSTSCQFSSSLELKSEGTNAQQSVNDSLSLNHKILKELPPATELHKFVNKSDTVHRTCKSPKQDSGFMSSLSVSTLDSASSKNMSSSFKVAEDFPQLGFKTASNKSILVPCGAIEKAKTLLDEAADSTDMISTPNVKQKVSRHSPNQTLQKDHMSANKNFKDSPVTDVAKETFKKNQGKAQIPCKHSETTKSVIKHGHESLIQDGALQGIHISSYHSGDSSNLSSSGFKTASNNAIQVSSANLEKARCLFKEMEHDKPLEECLPEGCVEAKAPVEGKQKEATTGPLPKASHHCQSSFKPKQPDSYGSLTASQKADVTELCNFLEEADSQFEFTQFQRAAATSHELTPGPSCDSHCREADSAYSPAAMSDFLSGIDFDDSFNADCDKQAPRKPLTGKVVSDKDPHQGTCGKESNLKINSFEMSKCELVFKTNSGKEKSGPLLQETAVSDSSSGCHSDMVPFHGFLSASGMKIKISRESLKKASSFFDDLDLGCVPLQNLSPHSSPQVPDFNLQSKPVIKIPDGSHQTEVKTSYPLEFHTTDKTVYQSASSQKIYLSREAVCNVNGFSESKKENCLHLEENTLLDTCHSVAEPEHFSLHIQHPPVSADSEYLETKLQTCNTQTQNEIGHCQTASGKEVKILEPLVEKPGALLSRVDMLPEDNHRHQRMKNKVDAANDPLHIAACNLNSFKTGSMNEEPEVRSVGATRKMADPKMDFQTVAYKQGNAWNSEIISAHPCGFQTAGGKKVLVSKAALKRAQDIFKEDDFGVEMSGLKKSDGSHVHKGDGFETHKEGSMTKRVLYNENPDIADQKEPSECHGGIKSPCKVLSVNLPKRTSMDSQASTNSDSNKNLGSSCGYSAAKVAGALATPSSSHPVLATKEMSAPIMRNTRERYEMQLDVKEAVPELNQRDLISYSEHRHEDNQANCVANIQPNVGFVTARGTAVNISDKFLNKARNMFADLEDNQGSKSVREDPVNISKQHNDVLARSRSNRNLERLGDTSANQMDAMADASKFSGDCSTSSELATVSEKALEEIQTAQKECVEMHTIFIEESSKQINVLAQNLNNISNAGLNTASRHKLCISEKAVLEANSAPNEFDNIASNGTTRAFKAGIGCTTDITPGKGSGFSTASGKRVSVSEKALQEAKMLLKDLGDTETPEPKQSLKVENTNISTPNLQGKCGHGFSTASGKRVSVSEKALDEAKMLLKEHDNVETTVCEAVSRSQTRNPHQKKGGCGFSTASGKKVCISEKALLKARAMLSEGSDIPGVEISAEIKVESLNVKSNVFPNILGKGRVAFSTASGKTVSIPEKALQEAKALLNQCGEAETTCTHGSHGSLSAEKMDTHGKLKEELNAIHAEAHESRRTPGLMSSLGATAQKHAIASKEWEKKTSDSSTGVVELNLQDGSSFLNLRSHGLGSCTDTQQRYLEQEAMACTKALLEDDQIEECSLGSQRGPPQTMNNATCAMKLQDTLEKSHRIGKRLRSEDADVNEEPPLKRQLLAEFDRTLDHVTSMPKAFISSPKGILTDRRTFIYNAPLVPNITHPIGDKKKIKVAEPQSTSSVTSFQESQLTSTRPAVFVPPFRKQCSPDLQKRPPFQEIKRPSGVFVPPFKKAPGSFKEPEHTKEKSVHPERQGQTRAREKCGPLPEPPAGPSTSVSSYKEQAAVSDAGLQINTAAGLPQHVGSPLPTTGCRSNEQECMVWKTLEKKIVRMGMPEILQSNQAPASKDKWDPDNLDAEDMIENLHLARDMQEMRIQKKKRQHIRPQPGSLFLAKTSGVPRLSLMAAVGGKSPERHTQEQLYKYGVNRCVSQIGSENAESFRFNCREHFQRELLSAGSGVQLADGGCLVPDNRGTAGKEEFYRALCDTPAVDPKLISESWVHNHYRWIVWKRAAMERAFPQEMGRLCLTPEQVLLQLKYRYDVEVDGSQRSAVKKITEKDDTPAKTLVLCVCRIISSGSSQSRGTTENKPSLSADTRMDGLVGVVEVTDGWYSIKALLDAPLTAMLRKGRLVVGSKIVTHGAELIGSQDACSPLEVPESLMLKISGNSTRPARWDVKLGFHRDPRPFQLPLSSLYCDGGTVGCVDVIVLRSYPTQWMEKKSNGVFVFRNDRAEEREDRKHADHHQKTMEVLFAKIQAEFEKNQEVENKNKNRRQRFSRQQVQALQDGEELHEAVESDPVYLEACLSEQQLATLNNYRRTLNEQKQARLQEEFRKAVNSAQEDESSCSKRDVSPVWKLYVADCRNSQSNTAHLLNIWRPSMDVRSLLKEGCRYRIYQLGASEAKKHSGNASLQLTATKRTQFEQLQVSPEVLSQLYHPREAVHFRKLLNPSFQPVCREVDLVGYVLSIVGKQGAAPVVYLVNGSQDFVAVKSWTGLSQMAVEDIVKPFSLLAVSNLQLRPSPPAAIPTVHAGELAVFSANPKELHLQEAFKLLKNTVKGFEDFFKVAEEKLSHLIQADPVRSLQSPKTLNSDARLESKNPTLEQTPKQSGHFTPICGKRTLPAGQSDDKDPKSLKRKRGLDYLSRIPSPPPLTPIRSLVSPCVKKTFQPPRRCEMPRTPRGEGEGEHSRAALASSVHLAEDEWVNDEELAMINTQALLASSPRKSGVSASEQIREEKSTEMGEENEAGEALPCRKKLQVRRRAEMFKKCSEKLL